MSDTKDNVAPDPDLIMLCFALALGSIGLCEGIFWTTAPALEPRNAGLACALVNTGGNGIGILAPVVTPLLADRFGWTVAIQVACGICLFGAGLWLSIRVRPGGEGAGGRASPPI